MSLRSPPGTGRQWPQLLAFIIDDEDRTRRASLLLRHLTIVLLVTGVMAIAVMLLARPVHRQGQDHISVYEVTAAPAG